MKYTRSQNIAWEALDVGAVLVDVNSGSRWTLTGIAASAWTLCDGTRTLGELAKTLRCSRTNVSEICSQFSTLGLLNGERAMANGFVFARSSNGGHGGIQPLGLGSGPRRRPSPRGNSGPG